MAKKILAYIFLALISVCIFLVGFMPKTVYEPKVVYQVYLDGEKIGLINSKNALEDYINQEQIKIKKEYGVSKVSVPEGLEVKKVITYSNSVSTAKDIYEKIKDLDSFTIKGYAITIKSGNDKQIVYTLNKEIFKEAVDKTIKAFVSEDAYNAYLSSTQGTITSTGNIIEDVSISQGITIKNGDISVNKQIFTNVDDLTKYLLYGTTETQATYTVIDGDTIDQIAYNNKLSTQEFLIANPEFSSANVLLLAGQVVNVGLVNPKIDVVEQTYEVTDEVKKYTTDITYDSSLTIGTSYVKQEGSNGLNRVSQRIVRVNGEATSATIIGTQELTPAVNQIIVKGDKYVSTVGITGYWYWPTTTPYIITTYYGYRWGVLHPAIDIAGPKKGAPIYAANNGIVTASGYNAARGYYIVINHNNGYYTLYEHLYKMYVSVNGTIARGQVIGTIGNSGKVYGTTGVHLHFEICKNDPLKDTVCLNPLKFY